MADDTRDDDVAPVIDRTPQIRRGGADRKTLVVGGLAIVLVVGAFIASLVTDKPAAGQQTLAERLGAAKTPPALDPKPLRLTAQQLEQLDAEVKRQTLDQQAKGAQIRTLEPPAIRPVVAYGRATDSGAAKRSERESESLFASNIVVSRRPPADQPIGSTTDARRPQGARPASATPSLDETAEAVVRASQRASGAVAQSLPGVEPVTSSVTTQQQVSDRNRPSRTPPISPAGPLHTLLESTIISAVNVLRLEGSTAAPVIAQVSGNVYSHRGDYVLIPAGARMIGESKPVQGYGDSRIGVTFHRLELPDGSTISLGQGKGLNQAGEVGLSGKVNRHYLSTMMVAAGVGVVTGLAQSVGNRGFSGDGDNRTTIITGDGANAAGQVTQRAFSRELNRLPTITVPEGARLSIYLSSDIDLPVYHAKEH